MDWAACQPCLGTQPARGTTCCFSHTNKRTKIRPAAKKTSFFCNPKRKKIGESLVQGENHPSRRPTHNHPQASPRPADPKCPLPQSCTTTACAYRVSHQSQKGQTSAPPTPHKTQFPSLFTRFATHTTKPPTPHSCPMTAHTHPHPIAHVPGPPQYHRYAGLTRATASNPAPPESPPFPTTCPHATGRTGPMPWSGPP